MKNLDINEAFENYFHELEGHSLRAERFYDDAEILPIERRQLLLKTWLEAAFLEGAKAIAKDTLETLGDYATSVAGINSIRYNLTEAFDIAAVDLESYYDQVLPK